MGESVLSVKEMLGVKSFFGFCYSSAVLKVLGATTTPSKKCGVEVYVVGSRWTDPGGRSRRGMRWRHEDPFPVSITRSTCLKTFYFSPNLVSVPYPRVRDIP